MIDKNNVNKIAKGLGIEIKGLTIINIIAKFFEIKKQKPSLNFNNISKFGKQTILNINNQEYSFDNLKICYVYLISKYELDLDL